MIKFSIITVCLNAGDDLLYTIESILNQNYGNFEIVLKDGLSSDNSISKLPDDSHLKIYKQKDKNVYDAMNQAIQFASGDYCIFINAGDALYEKNTLQQIASFIEANSGDFYYGKSHTVSSNVMNYGPKRITKFFCYRTTMCHQAMVIKTSFLKNRGYNTNFRISADREWMVYAFVEAKMRFVRMPMVVSNYKGSGISADSHIVHELCEETKQINNLHFNKCELIIFSLLRALTFPSLRRLVSRNPRLKNIYFKIRYKFMSRET